MRTVVWVLILLLALLHQDFWNRNDTSLVFGFLPVGLAYHIGLTFAAAAAWLLVVRFAWPMDDAETFGRQ